MLTMCQAPLQVFQTLIHIIITKAIIITILAHGDQSTETVTHSSTVLLTWGGDHIIE